MQAAIRMYDEPKENFLDPREAKSQNIDDKRSVSEMATDLSIKALQSVHGLVSQLKKVSSAIRRASAMEYNYEASKQRDLKHGVDEGAEDEAIARKIVDLRFPHASEQVQEFLSRGLSFRMRRFRDWKHHHEKIQKKAKAALPKPLPLIYSQQDSPQEQIIPDRSQPSATSMKAPKQLDNPERSGDSGVQGAMASSRRSFESARFEAPRSIGASTTVSKSVRSEIGGVFLDWPHPPRIKQDPGGSAHSYCPYCFNRLEIAEINLKTKWRLVIFSRLLRWC